MKEYVSFYDMPWEVQWVKAIQAIGSPVGSEMFKKCEDIIEKYPEYFEWEHKYNAVPKEVHDAFKRECYPERFRSIDEIIETSNGLGEQVKKEAINGIRMTKDDFKQMCKELKDSINRERKEKEEREKRIKRIWDKHYKKYGLECREF